MIYERWEAIQLIGNIIENYVIAFNAFQTM